MDWEDEAAVETWLETLPREVMLIFVQRAAQRVLPYVLGALQQNAELTFVTLRASLSTGFNPLLATTKTIKTAIDVSRTAHTAGRVISAILKDTRATPATLAARATLDAKRATSTPPSTFAPLAALATRAATRGAFHATRANLDADKAWIEAQADVSALAFLARPLWEGREMTEEIAEEWAKFHDMAPDNIWGFWKRWYQGVLDGKPLDWELQKRVALIDAEIWEQGPEAVAQEIAKIEAEFSHEQPTKTTKSEVKRVSEALKDHPDEIAICIQSLKLQIETKLTELEGRKPNIVEKVEEWTAWTDSLRAMWKTLESLEHAVARFTEKPAAQDVSAEEIVSLTRVYAQHITEWPRENAQEVVDNFARCSLIVGAVGLGAVFGIPSLTTALVAGPLFGGKTIAKGVVDAIKTVPSS